AIPTAAPIKPSVFRSVRPVPGFPLHPTSSIPPVAWKVAVFVWMLVPRKRSMRYSGRGKRYWSPKRSRSGVSGPVASPPSERTSLLCGAETFWNSLAGSISSSFPYPQNRLANLALPAEVSAKALTQPERDREKEVLVVPSLRGLQSHICLFAVHTI